VAHQQGRCLQSDSSAQPIHALSGGVAFFAWKRALLDAVLAAKKGLNDCYIFSPLVRYSYQDTCFM
jgi:hypothetical protein